MDRTKRFLEISLEGKGSHRRADKGNSPLERCSGRTEHSMPVWWMSSAIWRSRSGGLRTRPVAAPRSVA